MGASNVTASKPGTTGCVHRANKANASLPTSTSAALTDFDSLGYISEDGITNANTPTTNLVKVFGGANVLSLQTDKPDTWKFKLMEVYDVNVLKAIYGEDNVTGDLETGIAIKANTAETEERALVFDLIGRDGTAERIVCPRAQLTGLAEIKYADSEARGFEVTYLAIPDEDGNTHYHYIKSK